MSAPSNVPLQAEPRILEDQKKENSICPPPDVRSNINKPLPSGFVEYARRRVEERNREVFERTGGREGGRCQFFGNNGERCVCHGMGCEKLWNEWIALDCPSDVQQRYSEIESGQTLVNTNNPNSYLHLHGNIGNSENSENNPSSINSNNNWNTMARKQEKKMNKQNGSGRKTYRKRRSVKHRRASRNYRN